MKKEKLEEECELVQARQATDAAKYSVITNLLQDPTKEYKSVQTDPFYPPFKGNTPRHGKLFLRGNLKK